MVTDVLNLFDLDVFVECVDDVGYGKQLDEMININRRSPFTT